MVGPSVIRRERLARRTRVDRSEWTRQVLQVLQGVTNGVVKRIVRLRLDVHAHHVEAGAVVADRRATGATEEVEQQRACHRLATFRRGARMLSRSAAVISEADWTSTPACRSAVSTRAFVRSSEIASVQSSREAGA